MGPLCEAPYWWPPILDLLDDMRQVVEIEQMSLDGPVITKTRVSSIPAAPKAGLSRAAADALELAKTKVREGVGSAPIEEGAIDALGQQFAERFERYATQPEKWRLLSEDVFRKARLAGALGAFISEWEAGRNGRRTGAPTVTLRHLEMAMGLARSIDHGRLPVQPHPIEEETAEQTQSV